QAEDGIRDWSVTGVQTCALPISTSQSWIYFKPKQFSSQIFQTARAQMVTDPALAMTVLYDILNPGSPVGAPLIVGAPPVSSAIPIRLVYVHTLPTLAETDTNPIPGESDNALVSWAVAWARAKEERIAART